MLNQDSFDIILAGVGGQGLITLTQVVGRAALLQDLEFRSSELHGLSQRGGSVGIHVRIGNEVSSPLITPGELDLGLALEYQESLSCAPYASSRTDLLINEYESPTMAESATKEEVMKDLRKITERLNLIPASQICKKELDNEVVAGVFLLGYALKKKLIPFKKDLFDKAIEKELPQFYELNKQALELGEEYTKSEK